MDEVDVERGQMTESMLLAARLSRIQSSMSLAALSPECEDCGGEIPAGRRRALPAARRCVDCQEAHERGPR